ncbi:hypothetical protein HY604_00255 [Candidatus Peregrinibacteria bacterium]|nr:hypothetical protein [Candidatus Peregrinibacteria bacterium]
MFTKTKNKKTQLFQEKFLIFDTEGSKVNLAAAFNPEPLPRTQQFVNPRQSLNEFIDKEDEAAGEAMQKPIKETYDGIKKAVTRTMQDVFSVPQEAVDTVTGTVGKTFSWAARLAGSAIRLPVATAGYLASAPFALAGNIGRHALDIARVPFSAAIAGLAKISKAPLKVSAKAQEYRGRTIERSDKVDQKIQGIGDTLKNGLSKIKLPFISNVKPSTAGAKAEGENTGATAPAAPAAGGGDD